MLESNSDFGADDSLKILNSVMDKTKAKIEMSSSKDKSLTFLITGKQDIVLKARRELLSQFQVNLRFRTHPIVKRSSCLLSSMVSWTDIEVMISDLQKMHKKEVNYANKNANKIVNYANKNANKFAQNWLDQQFGVLLFSI